MRIVLDTNVLLSAAFFPGICDRLLAHCLISPAVEMILSDYILGDFFRHATGKFNGTAEHAQAFVSELRTACAMVQPDMISSTVLQDADDLPVLGTATAGAADYLVTGDRELLTLGRYQHVSILSPRSFFDRIQG